MAKSAEKTPPQTFQDLILTLQRYWAEQGCVLLQPYDMERGYVIRIRIIGYP